jgi:ABC-type uncharacterized transport system permease subunit
VILIVHRMSTEAGVVVVGLVAVVIEEVVLIEEAVMIEEVAVVDVAVVGKARASRVI